MAYPHWEIMCLTMPTRRDFLKRLVDNLGPQVMKHPEVRFTVQMHSPTESLGVNREAMRLDAQGDYINFVDDDDLVASDYVKRILPLLDGVDYIGFKLQCYEDDVPLPKPTYHSLLCGGWFESAYGWHRDLSHLNPMRRELSLAASMWGGFGEDSRWANDLRTKGVVRTEHYIEDTMYHYLSRPHKLDGVTVGQPAEPACPSCGSTSTVKVDGAHACNACGWRAQ